MAGQEFREVNIMTLDDLKTSLREIIRHGLVELDNSLINQHNEYNICKVTIDNDSYSFNYIVVNARNQNSMRFLINSGDVEVAVTPKLILNNNKNKLNFLFEMKIEDQHNHRVNYELLEVQVDDEGCLLNTDEGLYEEGDNLDHQVNNTIRKVKDNQIGDISYFAEKVFPVEGDFDRATITFGLEDITDYWPKYSGNQQWIARNTPNVIGDAEVLGRPWALYVVAIATRTAILHFMKSGLGGWPHFNRFVPKRPIDLDASQVKQELEDKEFYISWEVIESACSSLNSGKNIILTGPPGCGKTTFAKYLANEANMKNPLIVTASPSWSTNEMIGRYMPSLGHDKNHGIRFHEGFFLKAIDNWLIVDEMNRCNIDACFGELFTVLSGQYAILPFEMIGDSEDGESSEIKNIMILPYVPDGQNQTNFTDEYATYQTGVRFRMIGTMNDADASRLHQLSFAFQRRFNIIRMESPDPGQVVNIIENRIKSDFNEILNSDDRTIFMALTTQQGQLFTHVNTNIKDQLKLLFANVNDGETDLVQEKVVGVSQVNDVIKFVFEGLSTSQNHAALVLGEDDDWDIGRRSALFTSYIAMGVVMSVFHQLMSKIHDDEKLKKIIGIIYSAFNDHQFYRIELGAIGNEQYDVITQGTINQYLYDELKKLFYHTGISEEIYANPNDNADQ